MIILSTCFNYNTYRMASHVMLLSRYASKCFKSLNLKKYGSLKVIMWTQAMCGYELGVEQQIVHKMCHICTVILFI